MDHLWRAFSGLAAAVLAGALLLLAPSARADSACATYAGSHGPAAAANAGSFHFMEWTPFSEVEYGWETYLPMIAREIGTACPPGSPDFAAALATWQQAYGLPPTGVFDPATFQVFKGVWQERRPFVMARVRGECPEPPAISMLGYLVAHEEHADRLTRLLRRDVLQAYRAMVAAARAEVPELAGNPELLQIFSGFRDPEADQARCDAEGNCDGLRRAVCSPHRTGTAIDIYVGHFPDFTVDSTAQSNRLHQSRGAVYRWLVANAGRFGFVPYVYEPWHWEYVGPEVQAATP